MSAFWASVGVAIIGVLFAATKFVIIVPRGKSAVVERLGKTARLLTAGVHWVWFPLDVLLKTNWTYTGEHGYVRREESFVSSEAKQMDVPPVRCVTHDQLQTTVNVTVMYAITDLVKAIYESDDVLNYFSQVVTQSVRNAVASLESDALALPESGSLIAQAVNRDIGKRDRGIACTQVIVQDIKYDAEIMRRRQALSAEKAQNLLVIEKNRTAHEVEMCALKSRAEADAKKRELETEAARHREELEDAQAIAEQDRLYSFLKQFKEIGDVQQVLAVRRDEQRHELEMARVAAGREINAQLNEKCTTRTVLAPFEYWSQYAKMVPPAQIN